MDRITTLFEQLPLPEVAHIVRRTVYAAIAVGIVVLAVSAVFGYVLVGVGGCLGLGLGLANIRLVARSVARASARPGAHPRRALASHTLTRLGATTAIVIGLAFASVQLGLGTAGGVALFYLLYVASLLRSLLRHGTTGIVL
ncbi:MAG: hypothetical protein ABSC73_06280 [Acidimicrobiales bacterium]|jgi:hypothetical protein